MEKNDREAAEKFARGQTGHPVLDWVGKLSIEAFEAGIAHERARVEEQLAQNRWIVGPRFTMGTASEVVGWDVYETWTEAADDTFEMPGHARSFAFGETLSEAIQNAVKAKEARRGD